MVGTDLPEPEAETPGLPAAPGVVAVREQRGLRAEQNLAAPGAAAEQATDTPEPEVGAEQNLAAPGAAAVGLPGASVQREEGQMPRGY